MRPVLLAACLLLSCGRPPASSIPVPRTVDAIRVDGACSETSWRSAFRSPFFVDASGASAPLTELRATADDNFLYLEVYAADIDIETKGDQVQLEVGPLHLLLKPKEAVVPPGVKAVVDTDDTLDHPADHDEEWVSEIAIPRAMLDEKAIAVRALRTDVSRGKPAHALAWPRDGKALLHL